MNSFMSTNNDDFVNSLIINKYIRTVNVEKVFKSVNLRLYYANYNKQETYNYNPNWHLEGRDIYNDTDWQWGDVDLSEPSHYATVLECLTLQKGHKFLNIGSGIGYLSTLAGLLLGVNGVNHGIEIHNPLIDMAYEKLEEFKRNSAAIDYFEFCEPVFIKGNACKLLSEGYYDRVYCGAQVPPAEFSFMKALIKIGGVLVMPMEGILIKVIRKSEHSWAKISVVYVIFKDLVVPEKCSSMEVAMFPTVEPLSLQELCRSNIRASIRDCLIESHPGLQMRTKCKSNKLYFRFNINAINYGSTFLNRGESVVYHFQSERKDNALSKLLKVKIDLLQIPAMLKLFLNYNKED